MHMFVNDVRIHSLCTVYHSLASILHILNGLCVYCAYMYIMHSVVFSRRAREFVGFSFCLYFKVSQTARRLRCVALRSAAFHSHNRISNNNTLLLRRIYINMLNKDSNVNFFANRKEK